VKRLRLKNGLPVILAESHKLPLVSVDLVLKTGSSANPKDKAGLASLVANMLDEGTKKRTATQIANEVAQLGASLYTHATWDATAVSLSCWPRIWTRALPVWADVLLNPAFAQTISSAWSTTWFPRWPSARTTRRWSRAGLRARPVGRSPSLRLAGHGHARIDQEARDGRREALLRHLLRAQQRRAGGGGRHHGEAAARQDRAAAGQLEGQEDCPLKLPKAEAPEKPRIVLVDKPGAPQSSIRIGLPGIERKNPDYYRALVTNQILGGTFKRLAMNLRETKGWTYGVGSQFEARRATGPWTVSGEFVAAHTADAVEEILKEIEKLRADDVTDKELAETKDEIIGASPRASPPPPARLADDRPGGLRPAADRARRVRGQDRGGEQGTSAPDGAQVFPPRQPAHRRGRRSHQQRGAPCARSPRSNAAISTATSSSPK
jgi:zinc protease